MLEPSLRTRIKQAVMKKKTCPSLFPRASSRFNISEEGINSDQSYTQGRTKTCKWIGEARQTGRRKKWKKSARLFFFLHISSFCSLVTTRRFTMFIIVRIFKSNQLKIRYFKFTKNDFGKIWGGVSRASSDLCAFHQKTPPKTMMKEEENDYFHGSSGSTAPGEHTINIESII